MLWYTYILTYIGFHKMIYLHKLRIFCIFLIFMIPIWKENEYHSLKGMMHLTAYSVAWFLPCLHLTSLSQVSLHCLGVRVGNCFGRLTEVLAIMALWGCCPHWVFTVGTSTKQNKDKGSRIRTALPTRVDLGSVLTAGQDDPPLDMVVAQLCCPHCDHSFSTKTGLGVHKRWQHPAAFEAKIHTEWKKPNQNLVLRYEYIF